MENQNWRIFFSYPGILVLRKTRIGEIFFCLFFLFMREFSFRGKPESENFFFFFSLSENSRFVENQNRRIFFFLFFMREFSFCGKPESENFFFFFIRESSFCGKPKLENFFFFFCWRILVLWKTRIGDFFFFFLCENSRFVENQNRRFFFFFFFIREFSF